MAHGIGEVGEGLKANVFRGVKAVELGFMGAGKGFRSQPGGHTPESYSSREREEMRELARINEVQLSTHASPNVGYAAGWQEGSFREEARENVVHEVKRAIEFAADTAEGGPVVMHLGEFPRPLFKLESEGKFEAYPDEAKKAPIYVVDKRTGRVEALKRDTEISVPVPDPEAVNAGKVKSFEDRYAFPKRDPSGAIAWEDVKIYDLEQEAIKKKEPVEKYVFSRLMQKEIDLERGEELRWKIDADREKEVFDELHRNREMLEKEMKENKYKGQWDAVQFGKRYGVAPPEDSPRFKEFLDDPIRYIKVEEERRKGHSDALVEVSRSYGARRHDREKMRDSLQPIVEYGVEKSAETISRAALYAYEREKKQGLKKPLWIAPENWAPELYGSHPDEFRNIIVKSREEMQKQLIDKQGMSQDEAKKVASDHIKGTLDIGHANFWWKYYKGPKEDFDKWMSGQLEKLTKEGIIGHVHLSDNFGYHDEHLPPGEGNAPIQRFVEDLHKHGFKGKLIAEPGGTRPGQEFSVATQTWKLVGSPMYRIDAQSVGWTDIEHSYFGRAPQSPNFIVGDYAPGKDWTLWSEVPLE